MSDRISIPANYKTNKEGAFKRQVGGSYYSQFIIEPFAFLFVNKIPHHKAAIIRRILRYDHETGHGITDLLKIKHEIELIIELEGYKMPEDEGGE